jgi:hypothetical protein
MSDTKMLNLIFDFIRANFGIIDHELENIKLKIMLKEEKKKQRKSANSSKENSHKQSQ